ncbi:hypothetical protein BV20DRAFT_314966 [Pilatotrama ljubarskyi]|nr:hypothetical protein BV20DRAFT_314966 [Pilatotrama ljubarskyi]
MRAGLFAALFLSAVFVQARPPPEAKRDLIDNLTKVAEELYTSDIASIFHEATPALGSLFAEATSVVGGVLASNTALGHEATALMSAAESKATGLEKELASNKNGASRAQGFASNPLGLGVATALGSVLLGAYAVL